MSITRSYGGYLTLLLWMILLTLPSASEVRGQAEPLGSVVSPSGAGYRESLAPICFQVSRGQTAGDIDLIVGLSEVFGSANPATHGEDFQLVEGPFVIPAGSQAVEICPANLLDDSRVEPTEAFALSFLGIDRVSGEQSQRRVQSLITDDDGQGVDLALTFNVSGSEKLTFTATNHGPSTATGVKVTMGGQLSSIPRGCRQTGSAGSLECLVGAPLAPGASWMRTVDLRGVRTPTFEVSYAAHGEVTDDGASGVDLNPADNVADLLYTSSGSLCEEGDTFCNCYFIVMRYAVARLLGVDPDDLGAPRGSNVEGTEKRWLGLAARASVARSLAGMFFERADALRTLYRVRDRLATSPAGRRVIDLYYRHTAELVQLVIGSPSLTLDSLLVVDDWEEHIRAYAEGREAETTITAAQIASVERLLDRFEAVASQSFVDESQRQRAALDLPSLVGLTLDEASQRLDRLGCAAGGSTQCLRGERFAVNVAWTDFEGGQGLGRPVPLTDDTGAFWFFDVDNLELMVKVLDGRPVNGAYWVFYGALSDVEFDLGVTDTITGSTRVYRNEAGRFASRGDTLAFPSAARHEAGVGASRRTRAALSPLIDQVRVQPLRGERLPFAGGSAAAQGESSCSTDAVTLCLDGRFAVEVDWTDFDGGSGTGVPSPITSDTGAFWFFDEENLELMVKVLDARAINGHYWVFYGALSNVGYTLRVTDTATGEAVTYENPSGEFASRGDISALPSN